MTPIEKAKEALEEIINQDVGTWDKPVSFGILHTRSVDIARDALASLEAENPAEDACIDSLLETIESRDSKFWEIETSDLDGKQSLVVNVECATNLINQYAESYHAKKSDEELLAAADRAMAVYVNDCEGCNPRLAEDCDERCPYIARIRKAIIEAQR